MKKFPVSVENPGTKKPSDRQGAERTGKGQDG